MRQNRVKKITLVELRGSRNMTQKELADMMKVSSSLIGLYETGKRKPSIEKAMFIAKFFNTPLENISFATQKSG